MADFYWDRLPTSEYLNVRRMIQSYDYTGLNRLYEKYKLGTTIYCCGNSVKNLFAIFKYRYNQGKFNA